MSSFSNVGREMASWEDGDDVRKRILLYDEERGIRNRSVHRAVFWLCINIMYEVWWKIRFFLDYITYARG